MGRSFSDAPAPAIGHQLAIIIREQGAQIEDLKRRVDELEQLVRKLARPT